MDLSFLAELALTPGPFATAYLDVERSHENAPREIELRWRAERDDLAGQGADEDTLRALDEALAARGQAPGTGGRCLVGTAGRVVLDRPLPRAPRRAVARWAPLPHLMPYLAQLPRTVAYVVAVVDRAGADLYAFDVAPDGQPRPAADEVVEGDRRPITKVAVGGWSQRRYQQRAENLWEHNAGRVAAQVDRLVAEVGAEVVVVAGDPRASAALRASLPVPIQRIVTETGAGGRSVGASNDAVADAVAEIVERRYADDLAAVADAYARQSMPADGLEATVAALRERRVDTLLVRDDPTATGILFVGDRPDALALRADELPAVSTEPREDRADAALVRAAAGTGARLVVLSPDRSEPDLTAAADPDVPRLRLRDGVGFLARY